MQLHRDVSRQRPSCASRPKIFLAMGRLSSLFLLLAFSGCSERAQIAPQTPLPLIQAAPFGVTLVYDDSLKDQQCEIGKGYIAFSMDVAIGPASMNALNPAFKRMFETVEIVSSPASANQLEGKDQLTVRLTDYSACDLEWPIIGGSVAIEYEVSVAPADGSGPVFWRGKGVAVLDDYFPNQGLAKSGGMSGETRYVEVLSAVAIRRATANLIVAFETDEEVQKWRSSHVEP